MLTLWITGIGCVVTVNCAAGLVDAAGPGLLTVKAPMPWFCRSLALNATFTAVVLTTVVGLGEVFHITTEFASNPVPVIVIVAALPGGTFRGDIELIVAIGLFTSNAAPGEVPPPGPGFSTVIELAELPAISAAGIVAISSLALTSVDVIGVPFH